MHPSGHRARTFAETQWKTLVFPTLKLSTQHGYKNVLRNHVLPYWRDWRLRDIGPRGGSSSGSRTSSGSGRAGKRWRNSWVLLSGILETAVEYGYLSTNPARGVKFPQKGLKESPAIIAGGGDFARLLAGGRRTGIAR